jgi:hypothetical protein
LSFPTGLYIHGDIYFVCAPPTETSTTNHNNNKGLFVTRCLFSRLLETKANPRVDQQQITLYCQAPYILLSFPTALYIHARQFFHTHPSNPHCNRKIKTTNTQIRRQTETRPVKIDNETTQCWRSIISLVDLLHFVKSPYPGSDF